MVVVVVVVMMAMMMGANPGWNKKIEPGRNVGTIQRDGGGEA